MLDRRILAHCAVMTAIFVILAEPAYAYIDPGTGSVVTTAILGFFAAIGYTFRKYMYKIKDMFTGGRKTDSARKDLNS